MSNQAPRKIRLKDSRRCHKDHTKDLLPLLCCREQAKEVAMKDGHDEKWLSRISSLFLQDGSLGRMSRALKRNKNSHSIVPLQGHESLVFDLDSNAKILPNHFQVLKWKQNYNKLNDVLMQHYHRNITLKDSRSCHKNYVKDLLALLCSGEQAKKVDLKDYNDEKWWSRVSSLFV